MKFKPAVWYPIAAVLSAANVVAAGFAAMPAQPWHATLHATLAVAFGLWAQRLRQRQAGSELPGGNELPARLEALELEADSLRQELNEAQERLDFAERVLAQGAETRRLDREH